MRKHKLLIIFLSGFLLLITGIGSSYFWLVEIYLPEKIDANKNARLLEEWKLTDSFSVPPDHQISPAQLEKYLLVQSSLLYMAQRIKKQVGDESYWGLTFDLIRMHPEWLGRKYLALKKFGMTPKEYDFINLELEEFWHYRFKEISLARLREMGFTVLPDSVNARFLPCNYEMLKEKESELSRIFQVLFPKQVNNILHKHDAISDSLPQP